MGKNRSILFSILGALVGITIAISLGNLLNRLMTTFYPTIFGESEQVIVRLVLTVLGALIGAFWLRSAITKTYNRLAALRADEFVSVIIGLLLALLAGALLSIPLRALPDPIGRILPTIITILFAWLGVAIFAKRPHDLTEWFKSIRPAAVPVAPLDSAQKMEANELTGSTQILLDTSVIIDGRITDISQTGFINATLVVPNFVLSELQLISDSPDPIRRRRGRRGLEVLKALQETCPIPMEIVDMDVSEVRDVDSKLVALARHTGSPIMTNDYNLNRVAGLQGVNVLNINDLANAVKASFLPGEELFIKLIQEGREHGQGVGYLEDGTMVVVEDGYYHLNETHTVIVTKVLQTSAGRMIFARFP